MALQGYYTTYLRNLLQAKELGRTDFTAPDPLYFAWHLATTLSAACTASTNTISTTAPIAAGANIIVAPPFAAMTDVNAEQHVVLSVTGTGPYVLILTDNLLFSHLIGAYVAFDPGDNCAQLLEPIGNNYSRASKANTVPNFAVPVGGESDSAAEIFWPSPSGTWGLGTHVVSSNASSGGNARIVAVLQSFIILNPTNTEIPKIAAGNFISRARKPS